VKIVELHEKMLEDLQAKTTGELDGVLPSILGKAFKGDPS